MSSKVANGTTATAPAQTLDVSGHTRALARSQVVQDAPPVLAVKEFKTGDFDQRWPQRTPEQNAAVFLIGIAAWIAKLSIQLADHIKPQPGREPLNVPG